MIYVFRSLALLTGCYTIYLYLSGYSAGMLPVWVIVFIGSVVMSINRSYDFFMSLTWFKGVLMAGVMLTIIVLSIIVYYGHKDSVETESDVIIVLGAKVNPWGMSLTLSKRVDKAYDYLNHHPNVIAILSGGQGPDEPISEAQAMYDALVDRGIDPNRLYMESASKSTEENIEYSYQLMETIDGLQRLDTPKVMVISSEFHLCRASMIAQQQGYQVSGLGAKTLGLLEPNYYFREVFGVIYQFSKFFL